MNALDTAFEQARQANRTAFIPFVVAGDPDLATTARLLGELDACGATLIEIGFPYSDPIADGSAIQAAYTRALERGITVDAIFDMLRNIKLATPRVAMVSHSLVFRRGVATFITQARQAGLLGAIIPDLPMEEAASVATHARAQGFHLIQLVTPTTPEPRARQIAALSTGFLYCVSVVGTTGERQNFARELLDRVVWLKTLSRLPVCVGFGVSDAGQVAQLRDVADGVIVGSALVRQVGEARTPDDAVMAVGKFARALASATQRERGTRL